MGLRYYTFLHSGVLEPLGIELRGPGIAAYSTAAGIPKCFKYGFGFRLSGLGFRLQGLGFWGFWV